ncbi:MAG TPA: glycosyltransferase family 2 protein [Pyrinomonadaceae bacterium]|nr:glycosyltransferase family 2 protein [Pyrinomonadaceae bacterium]
MKNNPTLSVAMCTYNGAQYLRQQLDSIAAQTRLPDEIVVCDDGSSDETVEILNEFRRSAPFPVCIIVNTENIGITKNFERAIELCEGDIIALSDQDDVWPADKLRRLEQTLTAEDAGMVFSNALVVDANLTPTGRTLWDFTFDKRKRRRVKRRGALEVLVGENFVTGAAMAFWSRYRSVCLPIPTDTFYLHDGWLALTIAAVAPVSALDEPLLLYRSHNTQAVGVRPFSAKLTKRPDRFERHGNSLQEMASFLRSQTESYATVRARLLESKEAASLAKGIDAVESRIEELEHYASHFQRRSQMSSNRIRRAPEVIKELLGLRYHRYSNGFSSFAKDLLIQDKTILPRYTQTEIFK